ncbi:MAG: acyl carrier protein [Rhodocyclaceae bacterium]|nr:acyl carrier protein [Rhodocyclaceae bacterium]
MTEAEIRKNILEALAKVVPELEEQTLKSDKPVRDQLDMDSMDALNFMIGLHQTFEIEIPESAYAKLMTIDDCVRYVATAAANKGA